MIKDINKHLLFMILPLFGCAKNPDLTTSSYPLITEKVLPDGLMLQEVDLDRNGTTDIFNTIRPRADAEPLLRKKAADIDHDGRVDVITQYDEEGLLESESIDSDFDGQIDWIDHYQSATRVMSELDSDHDGKMDTFSYYQEQKLKRRERDTNADSRIDVWERYDEQEKLMKSGRDTDGDGKLDVRDE